MAQSVSFDSWQWNSFRQSPGGLHDQAPACRFIDLEESRLKAPIRTEKTPQVREIEALVGLDHLDDVFGLIKEKHIRRPVSR